MVFSSLTFLWLFLPLTLALYFAGRGSFWRDGVLVVVSLFFYAWGEPVFVVLMLAMVLSGFLHGRLIQKYRDGGRDHPARMVLWSGVGICLLALGIFKYLDFAVLNLNRWLGLSIPAPHLVLPIGISFYTFQMISYLVDVYRGATKAERSLLRLATYITMFSQLIAGPIVRYVTIAGELAARCVSLRDFSEGGRRFVIGLGKKVLLANPMGQLADTVFAQSPETLGAGVAWMGIVAYSFQIYFDFSGYSDMAIGLGRMFGFHFLENFNYPYVARSITDFWRRWHISLSSFFRDYVYIPLGGNRVSQGRWFMNVMVVWMLTGLWHGAAWNFVFWGLHFGVLLWLERTLLKRFLGTAPAFVGWAYTALAVLAGWVLFRTESVEDIPGWFSALLGMNQGLLLGAHELQVFWLVPMFLPAAIGVTPILGRALFASNGQTMRPWLADGFLVGVMGMSLFSLVSDTFNPFIYFRF